MVFGLAVREVEKIHAKTRVRKSKSDEKVLHFARNGIGPLKFLISNTYHWVRLMAAVVKGQLSTKMYSYFAALTNR